MSKSEFRGKENALERGKRIFGIVMICVSLLALFSWEKFGRAHFYYDDILVLRGSVQRGSTITPDMLKVVRTDRLQKDMLRPDDRKWIQGKAAAQFIHKGSPLYKEYFCSRKLLTGGRSGRYRICIPERWMISCPDDLHAGDRIHILSGGQKIAGARVLRYSGEDRSLQAVIEKRDAAVIEKKAAENSGLVICSE